MAKGTQNFEKSEVKTLKKDAIQVFQLILYTVPLANKETTSRYQSDGNYQKIKGPHLSG